jgi:hypothetical protein
MGKIQVNDPIRPRELTRLCAGETVDVALPEDVDNEGVLPVLGTVLPKILKDDIDARTTQSPANRGASPRLWLSPMRSPGR